MNFGFWNFYPAFNKNRMFTQSVTSVGRDWASASRLLGHTLQFKGHQVATLDMKPLEWFDKVFFIDYPTRNKLLNPYYGPLLQAAHPDLNLILCEPQIVRASAYKPEAHKPFQRVMTFKTDLCAQDPSKYIFFQPPCLPETRMEPLPFRQRKLCCMIQSYMVLNKPGELFSERVRAVRWFEAHAPQEFDLMGSDWDKLLFPASLSFLNLYLRAVYRRVRPLQKIKVRRFPSHLGPTKKDKHQTLRDYRFCVAYENSVEKDYISEKIFDSLFAGCVPIYLGAPNITDYIPAAAFIDKREFTYEELHRYLSTMTEAEYNGYLQAAADYLRSPALRPFTPEGYVEIFMKNFA